MAAGLALGGLPGCGARRSTPSVDYTLLDGSVGHTGQWSGKVMLVNFWATTCVVCVREMPQIVGLHRRFGARGYDTLAVAMAHDPPARVAQFAQVRQLPFGVAIDNTGAIARAFDDVRMTPTTLLVDRRTRIVGRFTGAPDFSALAARIETLLAQG
jgi:peroxiredoxin